jgi:excisionase family DNA binding protein
MKGLSMYLQEDKLSVPEVSKVLNCNETYVYRAIRNDRIKALNTTPTKVKFKDVVDYVDSTLPPSWRTYYKPEQVAL